MEQITGLSKILISSRIASEDTTPPPGESTRKTTALTLASFLICLNERIISYDRELPMEPSTVTTATLSLNGAISGVSPRESSIIEVALLLADKFSKPPLVIFRIPSIVFLLFSMYLYSSSDVVSVAGNLLKLSCRPNFISNFSPAFSERSSNNFSIVFTCAFAFSDPLIFPLTLSHFLIWFFNPSCPLLKSNREIRGSTGGMESTSPISAEFDDVRLPYSKMDCHITLSKFNAREFSMQVQIVLLRDDVIDCTDSKWAFEYVLSVSMLGAFLYFPCRKTCALIPYLSNAPLTNIFIVACPNKFKFPLACKCT
mmetsp:Transcript_10708/g.23716  ORF Transcript_10708/g.23716 Transcript_10708/m.23716 type:complete len:313 (+) Transcript_10708:829-1767(+)